MIIFVDPTPIHDTGKVREIYPTEGESGQSFGKWVYRVFHRSGWLPGEAILVNSCHRIFVALLTGLRNRRRCETVRNFRASPKGSSNPVHSRRRSLQG